MPSAVPDVLASGLDVVFVGINPGRVSAAAAAHFANPRNDFWRLLHAAGFTSRLYAPEEQFELLDEGVGDHERGLADDSRLGRPAARRLRRLGGAARAARARAAAAAWLGFVGKEAYRGAFGERPELGLQERRLGDTLLFVLPSTSPANAAVPWDERLRWFRALAGCSRGSQWRDAVRGARPRPGAGGRCSSHFDFEPYPWAPPGGGVDPGESDESALRRELAEEVGLDEFELGPLLWRREHEFDLAWSKYRGQRERCYLVRVARVRAGAALDLSGRARGRGALVDARRARRDARGLRPAGAAGARPPDRSRGPPPEPLELGR